MALMQISTQKQFFSVEYTLFNIGWEMWFFDFIREKRKQVDDCCNDLIRRISFAIEDYNAIFCDKERFIMPEESARWKSENKELFEEVQLQNISWLKKSKGFVELNQKVRSLLSAQEDIDSQRDLHNIAISEKRISDVRSVIGEVEGRTLDKQQLMAISKMVHTHLVLAGAGTGKTTTIVGLVKYLILKKSFDPEDILVLSFTNASASEMKERLDKETGISIEASTFHKLGLNIMTEVEGVKPKITEIKQSRFIKKQLSSLMNDSNYLKKLNSYLLKRPYLAKSEFDFKTDQEYQKYLKNNPPVTLNHERVKSYGELEIANFLFLNGVEYEYEASYKVDTRTKEFGQYRPDFFLPKYGIYIEYFGIDKNGYPPAYFKNDYVASMNWKRKLHKQNNTVMIESYAYENFEGILTSALEKKLLEKGVILTPLSQEEIWKRVSEDDANVIDGLVQLIETVINLMKSNRFDIAAMHKLSRERLLQESTYDLLDLIEPIWNKYNDHLRDNNEIDFNDMINKASDYVCEGKYNNRYKMVIVDEYQDISKARYSLLKALRDSFDYDLFCVGDDWQSIYRFSGSDIGYIQRFSDYWGTTEISKIGRTYRFPQKLIDITSEFIMRNPNQLRKSITGFSSSNDRVLGELNGYTEKNAVRFMISKFDELPLNSSVFLIGRYTFDKNILDNNSDLRFRYDNRSGTLIVEYIKRLDLKICFITAHRSKGLQADYVFILNNKDGRMGFPSIIQDSPILELLLEKSDPYPNAEERRLFYVAMTRAKKKVILLTLKGKESDFVLELHSRYASEMKQEAYQCPLCGGKLLLKKGRYGEFFGCENYKLNGCGFTRSIKRKQPDNVNG